MGKLSDRIEQNFRQASAKPVVVPEWGLTIYVFPLTLGQLSKIDAEEDPFKKAVRAIVVQAKHEDGSPMFDEEDYSKLLSHGMGPYGPAVISRVRLEISNLSASAPMDSEEAEKN